MTRSRSNPFDHVLFLKIALDLTCFDHSTVGRKVAFLEDQPRTTQMNVQEIDHLPILPCQTDVTQNLSSNRIDAALNNEF